MKFGSLIGQVIDGKYKIERQLGKGGMGTVYLATHVGTERPVAVKVIVQQFMQRAEFVERFRREARAAGRLRHPNVVDVTDFGIAEMPNGKTAYLVMEYLDGCTLGEILEEEKQLPLSWSLDILEQVCYAVHAAHEQGIIHRDLKPDNIWLEPNQRGGYTVKVLDFGIAKLEENHDHEHHETEVRFSGISTQAQDSANTASGISQAQTIADARSSTIISDKNTIIVKPEAGTLIKNDQESFDEKGTAIMTPGEVDPENGTAIMASGEIDLEDGTAIFPNKQKQLIEKEDGTKLIESAIDTDENKHEHLATAELTKVGAVLGTPLYMSPEQCRGEKLTPRSDIYSLGVIAYQMLCGKTPFEGDFTSVMSAHKEIEPPKLEAKKIPKKVKNVVHLALAKSVDDRPLTAEAFASILRSHSEGIGNLLTHSMTIFSERLPKFLLMAFLISIPSLLLTITKIFIDFLWATKTIESKLFTISLSVLLGIISFFVQIFTATFLTAVTVWIVAQILAFPLRPIELRKAFQKLRERWKPLLKTVTVSTLIAMVGLLFCIIPGVWLSARYMLIAPAIMMEGISGRKAFNRSIELVKRSYRTVLAAALLAYFIPAIIGIVIALAAGGMVGKMDDSPMTQNSQVVEQSKAQNNDLNINYQVGSVEINSDDDKLTQAEIDKKEKKDLRKALVEGIFGILWSPVAVLIGAFSSIITALIYFKTRLAGGESMQELLEQFKDTERPKTKWQQRVEQRLIQSGRITSKT